MLILLLWELSTLYLVDHLWPLILRSLLRFVEHSGSLVPAMWNRTSCAQVHEFPQSHCGDYWEDILFWRLHIYYVHLASVRFDHSVCLGSLMTTNITLLALMVEHSLVHLYQQCGTVHHVPKCMSCHKAIVVITGKGILFPWFHICYAHFASVSFEHSVCRGSLMTNNITLLALLAQHSLVHWYQQCGTVHHGPRCMSCHKAIMVITERAHCFHDYIYIYGHLPSVRFDHAVCRGSLMTTNIALVGLFVEHFLVHFYQQCGTVHHVPKCMSCHKAIVVITGKGILFPWFHICYAHFASVSFEHSVCRGSLMTTNITLLALLAQHSLVH